MVSFLKKENTIQGWLKKYSETIIVTNLLMIIIVLVLFFLMLIQHQRDITYFLQLDFFYENIDEFYGSLKQGVIAENIDTLNIEMDEMQDTLNFIKMMKGDRNFQRSIDDLIQLFEGFRESVTRFYFLKNTDETLFDMEGVYERIQEQYEFISRDFKQVYSETMTVIRIQENLLQS